MARRQRPAVSGLRRADRLAAGDVFHATDGYGRPLGGQYEALWVRTEGMWTTVHTPQGDRQLPASAEVLVASRRR